MNVLVTGGAGLIGMALRGALAARGHSVTAIDVTDFDRGDAKLQIVAFHDRPRPEALIGRCHVVDERARRDHSSCNFKQPGPPRATCSLPRRGRCDAFGQRRDGARR
jgi:NAD(P)-dependent dehydrogenase (short-subunit alcohol dehydrogenase family)